MFKFENFSHTGSTQQIVKYENLKTNYQVRDQDSTNNFKTHNLSCPFCNLNVSLFSLHKHDKIQFVRQQNFQQLF